MMLHFQIFKKKKKHILEKLLYYTIQFFKINHLDSQFPLKVEILFKHVHVSLEIF